MLPLVCSGDAGIYALATLTFELLDENQAVGSFGDGWNPRLGYQAAAAG